MRVPWMVLLAGCAWQAPLDPEAEPVPASLAGTVVHEGDVPPGDVVLVLYDAQDPPPPGGTGRPVTFPTVPAEAFAPSDAAG